MQSDNPSLADDQTAKHPFDTIFDAAYESTFANRERPDATAPIRVDDLRPGDVSWLLPTLTIITQDQYEDECVLVINAAILDVVDERYLFDLGASRKQEGRRTTYEFQLDLSRLRLLRHLAQSVDAVIAPGRRYDNKNLRWVCPRTSQALRRLAAVMQEIAPESDEEFDDWDYG